MESFFCCRLWRGLRFQTLSSVASGRALTIEDYYRIQAIGNAAFSPNSKWVTFTVTTRLEEPDANSSRSDAWLVPADGSAEPRRVQHMGKDVANPGWADGGWLQDVVEGQRWKIDPDNPSSAPVQIAGGPAAAGRGGRGGGRGGESGTPSPDGKWDVEAVNKPVEEPKAVYASEFEKRHQERFKGAIFDWKDFQRDGAEFPAPNPVAQPAQQIIVRPRPAAAAGTPTVLVDLRSPADEPRLAAQRPDHRVHGRS